MHTGVRFRATENQVWAEAGRCKERKGREIGGQCSCPGPRSLGPGVSSGLGCVRGVASAPTGPALNSLDPELRSVSPRVGHWDPCPATFLGNVFHQHPAQPPRVEHLGALGRDYLQGGSQRRPREGIMRLQGLCPIEEELPEGGEQPQGGARSWRDTHTPAGVPMGSAGHGGGVLRQTPVGGVGLHF